MGGAQTWEFYIPLNREEGGGFFASVKLKI